MHTYVNRMAKLHKCCTTEKELVSSQLVSATVQHDDLAGFLFLACQAQDLKPSLAEHYPQASVG